MQTYEIIVSGRAVHANSADTTLVRTSIGIDKIHVLFDNTEWTAFPVRVTFANGDTIISTSLTLTEIDAPEWAAEAECTIPWEVIQDLGGIRITFQGTDASGNHIITEASGEPLSVVEAGDVGSGTVPSPAPSVDEWNQAYANAMAAANSASGAAESATEAAERANTAAADAEQVLVDGIPLMNADTRGGAKLGDGLEVDENEALNAKVGGDITIDGDGAISYELPIMSATQHGGATLGNGLRVDDGALSLGDLTQSGSGAEVVTDGCAIFHVDGEGWATQDGTPTPDNPVEIQVARGRNLATLTELVTSQIGYADQNNAVIGAVVAGKQYTISANVVIASTFSLFFADSSNKQGGFSPTSTGRYSVTFTAAESGTLYFYGSSKTANAKYLDSIQLELGTTPTPYVPYGCVGLEVQAEPTLYKAGYSIGASGAESANAAFNILSLREFSDNCMVKVEDGSGQMTGNVTRVHAFDVQGNWLTEITNIVGVGIKVFSIPNGTAEIRLSANVSGKYAITTTTPIPLPTKGFAASLPDGTADALTVDSAGRWEWVNETEMPTFDETATVGTNGTIYYINRGSAVGSVGLTASNSMCDTLPYSLTGICYHNTTNIIRIDNGDETKNVESFKAWLASHNLTFLLPLATPTTEHGYIDLPALPSGATVSCPELESIGVSWFVDGCEPIVEHAANMARRETEENESIEDALAELAARVAALES